MFASRHFQALKNNPSVGQHIFFHFFYIFNIFIPSSVGKKRKEISGDLFRDLGP